ncbi:hypothetical protein L596_004557 [Steinernema carpocapsae]|uniref:Uncharacterized protein n=1 Tax=Steinernema carpocapsae TaxID=34508 RepID=A0A4U8UW63_STECR|nr:hypothetical protein L596_004557 [Steinernema carpocapsae]
MPVRKNCQPSGYATLPAFRYHKQTSEPGSPALATTRGKAGSDRRARGGLPQWTLQKMGQSTRGIRRAVFGADHWLI